MTEVNRNLAQDGRRLLHTSWESAHSHTRARAATHARTHKETPERMSRAVSLAGSELKPQRCLTCDMLWQQERRHICFSTHRLLQQSLLAPKSRLVFILTTLRDKMFDLTLASRLGALYFCRRRCCCCSWCCALFPVRNNPSLVHPVGMEFVFFEGCK